MVRALLFSRFLQLRRLLVDEKKEANKERFILSAFIGWQMGAGGNKKFGEYLAELGLLEGQAIAGVIPESKELSAKEAVAKAEEILAMARKKEG